MSQFRLPGPVCRFMAWLEIDSGTLCRIASPLPGPVGATPVVTQAENPSEAPAPTLIQSSPSSKIYSLLIQENAVYGEGKFKNSNGDTECVELVRQATGAPQTSSWKSGLHVRSAEPNKIARGTAIATFDDNGKYPTDALGKHAAIYLSHNGEGIQVLDQWNSQGEVKQRLIKFNRPPGTNRSNNGDTFYVIENRDL